MSKREPKDDDERAIVKCCLAFSGLTTLVQSLARQIDIAAQPPNGPRYLRFMAQYLPDMREALAALSNQLDRLERLAAKPPVN